VRYRVAAAVWSAALVLSLPAHAADGEAPVPDRQRELIRLVRHDCGSCHGMTLAGGLGPALSAQALADRPHAYLQQVILGGRPGTAMPPWRGLLTDQDADWIARQLKRGFPDGQ
jgi:cytochrome c55X